MLDWTGERFVPWAKEAAVAYEHLHRYMWASTLVRGKRVLDLASGEGYGANLLAGQAAYVCGVDIDEEAVRHAAEKYSKSNLHFLKGSITDVPIPEERSFDVIVCFEAIEHIEDHDTLLSEVRRLLKPDGLFIVSTPNKDVYDAGGQESNPFHVKELTFDEFNALLSRHFSRVDYLGQRLHPASSLWPIGRSNGSAIREFVIERAETEFAELQAEKRVPRYFIGIASDASGISQPGSVLLDHSDELTDLLVEKNRNLIEKDQDLLASKASADTAKRWFEEQLSERSEALVRRGAEIEKLNKDVEQLTEGAEQLNKDVEQLNKNVEELTQGSEQLNKALEWAQNCNQDLERTISSRDEALAWRASQVDALEKAKIELLHGLQTQAAQFLATAEQLRATYGELGLRNQELAEIHMSRSWKIVMKLRAVRDRLRGIF